MKSIKSKEKLIVIITTAIFLLITYNLFFYDTFNSDAVANFYYGRVNYPADPWWTYITSGRFMGYVYNVVNWLLNFLHISKLYREWPMQVILIAFLVLAVSGLYELFQNYFTFRYKEIILPLVISIAFVNPFFVETFVYVGYELGFAIWLSVMALKRINNGGIKNYIIAALLLIMSVSTYQVYFELILIWGTMLIYLQGEGKITKRTVVEFIKLLCIVGVAVIFVIALTKGVANLSDDYTELNKIAANSEVVAGEAVVDSYTLPSFVQAYTTVLLGGFNAYPHRFLLIITAVVIVVAAICVIKERKDLQSRIQFVLLMLAMNLYYVAIFFSGYDGLVQRVLWPFFACFSCMLLTMLYLAKTEILVNIAGSVIVVFMLINQFVTNSAVTDFMISNKIDRQIAGEVQAEIVSYEQETGNEIKKISVYATGYKQYTSPYLNLKDRGAASYNRHAMFDSWSDVEFLNFIYWEYYEEETMSEEKMQQLFADKNPQEWYTFMASKQLVFEGDTLYWYVY